jgi:hypothetical protein
MNRAQTHSSSGSMSLNKHPVLTSSHRARMGCQEVVVYPPGFPRALMAQTKAGEAPPLFLGMQDGKDMPSLHMDRLQEMPPTTKSNFPMVDGHGKRKRSVHYFSPSHYFGPSCYFVAMGALLELDSVARSCEPLSLAAILGQLPRPAQGML